MRPNWEKLWGIYQRNIITLDELCENIIECAEVRGFPSGLPKVEELPVDLKELLKDYVMKHLPWKLRGATVCFSPEHMEASLQAQKRSFSTFATMLGIEVKWNEMHQQFE